MRRTHRVGSVMTADVARVAPGASFKAVAALLQERGVGGAPVVDEDDRVLGVVSRGDSLEREVEHRGVEPRTTTSCGQPGIVSRADLVRVFLRPDNEIRDEVRDEVLEREMCLDPLSLYVSVKDGVVSLSGQVERYSMIPIIVALTGRVDGVVEVKERLRAQLDDRHLRPDAPAQSGPFGNRSPHRP